MNKTGLCYTVVSGHLMQQSYERDLTRIVAYKATISDGCYAPAQGTLSNDAV